MHLFLRYEKKASSILYMFGTASSPKCFRSRFAGLDAGERINRFRRRSFFGSTAAQNPLLWKLGTRNIVNGDIKICTSNNKSYLRSSRSAGAYIDLAIGKVYTSNNAYRENSSTGFPSLSYGFRYPFRMQLTCI